MQSSVVYSMDLSCGIWQNNNKRADERISAYLIDLFSYNVFVIMRAIDLIVVSFVIVFRNFRFD